MLRKRKEPKVKRSVVEALMRDMQGTATEKLALFKKLKAAGGFANESAAELRKVENMLRTATRFWHGPTSAQNSIRLSGLTIGTACM